MQETSKRVNYLYDLQDAGYDAEIIRDISTAIGDHPNLHINTENPKDLRVNIRLQTDQQNNFQM